MEEGYFRNFQPVYVEVCTSAYVHMHACMGQSIGLIAFESCWEKIGKQVKTSSRDIYGIGIFAAIPDFHFPFSIISSRNNPTVYTLLRILRLINISRFA